MTRYWRCYILLIIASVLSCLMIFISQHDPNLDRLFPYFGLGLNSDYYSQRSIDDLKKLIEKNDLDYEYMHSNSRFCLNSVSFNDDSSLVNEMAENGDDKIDSKHDLIFLIITEAFNLKNRNIIRQTWAKSLSSNIKDIFIVGNPTYGDPKNAKKIDQQSKLYDEIKSFKDMIQINMYDNLNYTTTKTLLAIRWSLTFCSNTKYLFVLSDSAAFNSNLVDMYFKNRLIFDKSINDRTLAGYCNYTDEKLKILFSNALKTKSLNVSSDGLKVNKVEVNYKGEYCSNLGWMLNYNAAKRLWLTALKSPFMMRLSPAYLNGYLAFKANLKHLNLFSYFDHVPLSYNCLTVFKNQPGVLLCAENFTITNRFSNYISTWNSPGQLQFGLF